MDGHLVVGRFVGYRHVELTSRRLLTITALVAVCAEFLVSAIEQVVEQWHISETFVGLILLPIVGK